eukprot:298745-Lingulodinium_polyedra.AAC.1
MAGGAGGVCGVEMAGGADGASGAKMAGGAESIGTSGGGVSKSRLLGLSSPGVEAFRFEARGMSGVSTGGEP